MKPAEVDHQAEASTVAPPSSVDQAVGGSSAMSTAASFTNSETGNGDSNKEVLYVVLGGLGIGCMKVLSVAIASFSTDVFSCRCCVFGDICKLLGRVPTCFYANCFYMSIDSYAYVRKEWFLGTLVIMLRMLMIS